jgi:hypothetical protein
MAEKKEKRWGNLYRKEKILDINGKILYCLIVA